MATYKNDIILIAGSGDFAFEAANYLNSKNRLNHIILLTKNSKISKFYKNMVSKFDVRDMFKMSNGGLGKRGKTNSKADKIVFPGVGAMRDCMQGMHEAGIDEVVRQAATVNANNLIVLEQIVRLQAESEDKAIVSTLNNAIEVLAPYKAILAQQKIEVATELPQFVQAIEAGDDAVWNKVKIRMIQVFNVVKQDKSTWSFRVELRPYGEYW